MKVINYGSSYEIYENDLKTYDKLPAQTYKVRFNPMSGFSLVKVDDFELKEDKVYGNRLAKIEKVLHTFKSVERSLGVILSGDKGIGKSLFTQILSQRAVEEDMPVILVTKAYPGIAEFIDSIDQETLVLFDEFEKVFDDRDGKESQNSLLSLFDGLSQRKRIYAITVNSIHRVNDFMLNRPGRFHYHIRFDYPNADEIRVYLADKIDEQYHSEIENVVKFSRRIKLNYDCLRAIALELGFGTPFNEAIMDLNIINIEDQCYTLSVYFDKLTTPIVLTKRLDLFSDSMVTIGHRFPTGDIYFDLSFNGADVTIDNEDNIEVSGDNIMYKAYENDDDDTDYSSMKVTRVSIKQKATNTYSYSAL